MEIKEESRKKRQFLLGKKTNRHIKEKNSSKSNLSEKGSFSADTSAELSSDNLLSLEEKEENNSKILYGFDDLEIPGFLNDSKKNKKNDSVDKVIKNYFKIKEELGSPELSRLYLIDINRLYELKRKSSQVNN